MAIAAQTFSRTDLRKFAFTQDAIMAEVRDHVFSHSPTLMLLASRDLGEFGGVPMRGAGHATRSGGFSVVVRARLGEHAGAKAGASDFDTHNVAPDDNVRFAEFNWRFYTHAAVLSEHDLQINRGAEAISSFLEDQTQSPLLATANLLAQHIHSTVTPANAVTSLDDQISANDQNAGLSGATFDPWNSRGVSPRGTAAGAITFASGSFAAQGLSDLRTAHNNASEGLIRPTVVITEYDTHERYEGVLQPSERFQGAVPVADGSFRSLAFRSAPVMADPHCAAGLLYFLRPGPDGIQLIFLDGADFDFGDWKPSSNQNVMVRPLMATCTLVLHNRRYGANKLTGIID